MADDLSEARKAVEIQEERILKLSQGISNATISFRASAGAMAKDLGKVPKRLQSAANRISENAVDVDAARPRQKRGLVWNPRRQG